MTTHEKTKSKIESFTYKVNRKVKKERKTLTLVKEERSSAIVAELKSKGMWIKMHFLDTLLEICLM